MKIVLRKMNEKFEWVDASQVIEVRDTAHANQLVFAAEDASGGYESYNFRVVEH